MATNSSSTMDFPLEESVSFYQFVDSTTNPSDISDNDIILIDRGTIADDILVCMMNSHKSSVVLSGDSGVGKSSLIDILCHRVMNSYNFSNTRLYIIDTYKFVSQKVHIEARLDDIASLASHDGTNIFVWDDMFNILDSELCNSIFHAIRNMIHSKGVKFLFVVDSEDKKDLMQLLKSDSVYEYELKEMSKNEMDCIIDTNIDYFKSSIGCSVQFLKELNGKIANYNSIKYPKRFFVFLDSIILTTIQDAMESNEHIKAKYAEFKKVRFGYNTLKSSADYEKALKHKELYVEMHEPLIEMAKNAVSKRNIDTGIINTAIRRTFGFMQDSYSDTLSTLKNELPKMVIGQSNATDSMIKNLVKNSMFKSNKTLGVYMLLGPSGVGKTELAKSIAHLSFNGRMVRLDMGEYTEKLSISRLIGAAPGYVGYDNGGQLTEALKSNPSCVLLIDEIEKANADVLNVFLNIFDEGYVTDAKGTKIDCTQCLIIMTSNLGVQKANDKANGGIGFANISVNKSYEFAKVIDAEMKKHFKPELINRMDDTIIFNTLDKDSLKSIFKLNVEKFNKELESFDISISVDDDAANFIVENTYKPIYGARPLKRYIDNDMKYMLADYHTMNKGKNYTFALKDGSIYIK